eukprot:TRINITY_DN2251_c0_g3_i3.p1 TRINITY_DN2251_c0_g3~~TRINITY_DN2251_c0_g3_i3.p1  ORF type:complete len:201 (-),score=43.94 TRINITY_DN2251_c0_g3_i3:454-1056(-)
MASGGSSSEDASSVVARIQAALLEEDVGLGLRFASLAQQAEALQPVVLRAFDPAAPKPKPLRPLVDFLERQAQLELERRAQLDVAFLERLALKQEREHPAQQELRRQCTELENARGFLNREDHVMLPSITLSPAQLEARDEGLSFLDPIKTNRVALCINLLNKAFAEGPLLVHAPPYSGKTSLAMTLLPWVGSHVLSLKA